MKVFFIASILSVVLAGPVFGLTWTVANQKTIAWNAVTLNVEGTAIPTGDTLEYDLYVVKSTSTDKAADKIKLGTTETLEYTLTFPSEGRWLAGIQAIRIPAVSPEDRLFSELIWSDVVDVALVPVPFGFIYFANPADPGGFGPK
jgi:hypothetical protein